MTTYQKHGYKNREDYLRHLAADYRADPEAVFAIAQMFGPNEDFDGLVVAVQDWDWDWDGE